MATFLQAIYLASSKISLTLSYSTCLLTTLESNTRVNNTSYTSSQRSKRTTTLLTTGVETSSADFTSTGITCAAPSTSQCQTLFKMPAHGLESPPQTNHNTHLTNRTFPSMVLLNSSPYILTTIPALFLPRKNDAKK